MPRINQTLCIGFYPKNPSDASCIRCTHENGAGYCTFFKQHCDEKTLNLNCTDCTIPELAQPCEACENSRRND